jgi:hypothetical protein
MALKWMSALIAAWPCPTCQYDKPYRLLARMPWCKFEGFGRWWFVESWRGNEVTLYSKTRTDKVCCILVESQCCNHIVETHHFMSIHSKMWKVLLADTGPCIHELASKARTQQRLRKWLRQRAHAHMQ